ncbi:hypothetical protein LTR84_013009 [Exophiala bonariae]|uniref:Transcription factor domain-containing protein n=1 Tax=Exophiala bonariae TaxID=1690606 RepID=A0AAV9NDI1_9EURO|nr:hypothetical protein LTR84_013009 [Exophiala bonariae]
MQVWVDVPPFIGFVHENGHGVLSDGDDPLLTTSKTSLQPTQPARNEITNGEPEAQVWELEQSVDSPSASCNHEQTEQHYSPMQISLMHGSYTSDRPLTISPQLHTRSPGTVRNHFSPKAPTAVFGNLHRTNSNQSAYHISPNGPLAPQSSMRPGILGLTPEFQASSTHSPSVTWPFQTNREAKLFYHYINHISPWIDVLDSSRHFGVEIPRRAAYHPLISNAIYAISALHLSLIEGTEDLESPRYVDESLQYLKQILEDPSGHSDENLLAGVIILRSHEEMSDKDDNIHLLGGQRILNSIASYAADGGLRESASWISLRQHIYISITKQSPLGLNLNNYEHSMVFVENSDEAWANRAVFLLACVLNYAFSPREDASSQHNSSSSDTWAELEAKVDEWARTKPWYFSPLWTQAIPNGQQDGNSWPEVLTSHPTHAVGLQYYALSKIVLTIYNPRLTKLGFGSHRLIKAAEATVLQNLRTTIGIAVSNPDVTNTMFQSSHILAACGSYLHDPKDQAAVVEFLTGMQQSMGWRTDSIIQRLKEEWNS